MPSYISNDIPNGSITISNIDRQLLISLISLAFPVSIYIFFDFLNAFKSLQISFRSCQQNILENSCFIYIKAIKKRYKLGQITPLKKAQEIPESKSSLMISEVAVHDIYKLINKCYIKQEVWIPLQQSVSSTAFPLLFHILKTTVVFRSVVFPTCSRC